MSKDWIKMRGRKNVKTWCERCGESITLHLPMSVRKFADLTKKFIALHRGCKERKP